MIPEPIRSEPERYQLSTYKQSGRPRIRISPEVSSDMLDKWDFEVREDDSVVLAKHIGGEKYRANHTVPDAIPLVVRDVLWREGYTLEEPDKTVAIIGSMDLGRKAQVPVDDEGRLVLDALADHTREWVEPLVDIEDE